MRPVANPLNVAVLDRIEVNVLNVMAQIAFIVQQALPVASLPDTAFLACHPACRAPLGAWYTPRKQGLDMPPACCIVGIVRGQSPNAVQV
ncbi:MAG: hypothetical protein ABIQ70_06005, partial [Dokdonella sp.]